MTEELCCSECRAAVSEGDRFCTACGIELAVPSDGLRRAGPQAPATGAIALGASSSPNVGSARPTHKWFRMEGGYPQPSGVSTRSDRIGTLPPAESRNGLPTIKGPRHRYASLRLIADLLTVIAYLALIGGTVGVIAEVHYIGKYALLGLVSVGLVALAFFAFAAVIRLMISLEENTRRTADLMVLQVTDGAGARSRLSVAVHDTPASLT
jgi:hypothetical protein